MQCKVKVTQCEDETSLSNGMTTWTAIDQSYRKDNTTVAVYTTQLRECESRSYWPPVMSRLQEITSMSRMIG